MAETYPTDNALLNLASDSETGVEYIETGKAPYYLEFRKLLYRLLLAAKRANDLRVFDEGSLDIGVKAGKFWDGSTPRTYSGSTGNTLADDKAHIYVYISASGTLVIDEYGSWPPATVNHIRLADVTTSGGDITSIVDARDHHQFFSPGSLLDEPEFYSDEAGASVEIMAMHWDSASPAPADAMKIGLYGEDDGSNKTEYGRITLTIDDETDTTEDASLSFSVMVGSSLTSQGDFVGTESANADGKSLANVGANGGVTIVLTTTLTAGSTVQIHNSNAPFKYRVLDAWSVAKSADGGTWKVTDGTDDITNVVTVTGTDKTINRAGTIDDAKYEIPASGSLSVVGDGANADCEVNILCVRVA